MLQANFLYLIACQYWTKYRTFDNNVKLEIMILKYFLFYLRFAVLYILTTTLTFKFVLFNQLSFFDIVDLYKNNYKIVNDGMSIGTQIASKMSEKVSIYQ